MQGTDGVVPARKGYIREFEGLRGAMASWVVLGHAFSALPVGTDGLRGSLYNVEAVDVFIALSGFVIFSLLDRQQNTSYFQYIVARFFRIFPVYFLVLILSTICLKFDQYAIMNYPGGTETPKRLMLISVAQRNLAPHFLAHLTMLQGLIPGRFLRDSSFTLVGQAWSISVEWQFYLIAPFLFMWISTLRRWQSLVALGLVATGSMIYGHFTDSGFAGNNMGMFAIGFASYFFYRSDFSKINVNLIRIGFVAVAFFGFFVQQSHFIGLAVWLSAFYAVIAARRSGGQNLITRVFLLPPVLYVGRVSYSLYLVHMQVLFALMWFFRDISVPVQIQYVALPAVCLATAIAVSAVVHHTIEAPLHDFGRRLSKASGKRLASAPAN
jgi:peptidoglycan/LPS O-acetylase OafA/YrhL